MSEGVLTRMSDITPEQRQDYLDITKKSLWYLCKSVLSYKDWDVVHDDLEKFLYRPAKRKAILLPRGHLKSSIVTIGKSIQFILQNPNVRILIANQVWDVSRAFLRAIKGHLETDNMKYFYGDFRSDKWNEDLIIVRQRTNRALKEPTILTTGTEAETTGGHFDVIFLDDLMGLQNSQTPEQRAKAKRFRRSMLDLLEPDGTLIEIGTRWHLDDPFSDLLEKESMYYDVMVRRVVENGKCIFPRKFNKRWNPHMKLFDYVDEPCMDYIEHLKATHTTSEFNSQYLNNPIDEDTQIFKSSYFRYWDRKPEGLHVAMTIDPAISLRQEADYTAITVAGMDKDANIFILDTIRGHWTPSDIVRNIFDMHAKWKPVSVGLETAGFQRTLKYSLEEEMRRRRIFFGVEELKNSNQVSKESRIKALEPYYRSGKVFHSKVMAGRDLEEELTTFPKGRHDDLIDAESMLLNLLVPGSERRTEQIPRGSWEWEFRQARAYMRGPSAFFNWNGTNF